MRKLILRNHQSPGDIVVLTLVLALLHRAYPGQFLTDVRTSAPAIWENNPWITPLSESDPEVEVIDMHYPLIHQSNQRPYHFLHAFVQYLETRLNLTIPVTKFSGEIYLTDEERESPLPGQELPDPYWIMIAGCKPDFTAKLWNPASYQRVVDHFRGVINFVQCGESGHWHRPLDGVTSLVGKTSLRQFVRLMHHAAGVVCPVTLGMHLAAAVETRPGRPKLRPCVVIAGGREPAAWEEYPGHQFLHTIGALTCCQDGGCWKSRCQLVGDGDEKDRRNVCEMPVQITPDLRIPRCMDIITPEDVIRHIEYYREGGVLSFEAAVPGAATNGHMAIQANGHAMTPSHAPKTATAAVAPAKRLNMPVPSNRLRRQPVRQTHPTRQPGQAALHRLLLEFLHGLGDSVQLSIVLKHLKHYHPEWEIDLAALHGKHSVGHGLCHRVFTLAHNKSRTYVPNPSALSPDSVTTGAMAYDRVVSLDWHECRSPYAQWPSTKPMRCLQEVFHLEPVLELCRYEIARSAAADEQARAYLAEVCPSGPGPNGRYPVVLLHYQGNTSCDRKDLTHNLARSICDIACEQGYVPVILDWDNRSPLVDQQRVFNPGASHALWHNRGTGDAEILAALIEASSLMIGVDSGPLHVAGATTTPTLGIWTWHHPVHYFDLAPNVLHLIPGNQASLALGSAAVGFFERHYKHAVYTDLTNDIAGQMRQRLEESRVSPSSPPAPARIMAACPEPEQATAVPVPANETPRDGAPRPVDRPHANSAGRSPRPRGRQAAPTARTAVARQRNAVTAKPVERRGRGCQTCNERKQAPVEIGQPQPSERILTSTLYDRQYYEEHKQTGLDYLTFGDWQREYGRWFVESLNLRSRRVLDTGCACGAILLGLMEAGVDAEGFDLSDYMIQLGRRKWPHMASRLHVADAAELSRFQNESFDAIHSSQVAEHWPAEAVPRILRELARITSPGGLFFCALDTEELFARQGRTQETEDPTHICIRPRAWWIEQLEINGWQDATAEYEPILKSHPLSFLRRYDWDWFVGRKEGN